MKTLLLSLLALITFGITPYSAQSNMTQKRNADIQQAENYLHNLKSMKANFIQKAHNGALLSGKFYLNRPGKLRFEYNEIKDFIVADGIFIYFYDSELDEQTNAPIGQTLADFILRDDIKLNDDVTVQNVEEEDGYKTFNIHETGDASAGSIKLFFTQKPFSLAKWQVRDAAGLTTEITLRNIETDIELSPALFRYFKPKQDKPQYN